MAQFQNVITTLKGRTLIAKMIAGAGNIQFKNIQTSSDIFTPLQLPSLDELTTINQTTPISRIMRTNDAAIRIEGAVNNIMLRQSYNCNTVGITATDPDDGEILFGVTIVDLSVPDNTPDFIPAFNGITNTGILFDLILTVDNSGSVSLQVDPAAVVTVRQLGDVYAEIAKLQAGLEALYNNSSNITLELPNIGAVSARLYLKLIGTGKRWQTPWNTDPDDEIVPGFLMSEAGSILNGSLQLEDGTLTELFINSENSDV